jgi:gamma-glutamylcyclotransferase (GGCT)/AIG2-like uncharacterized protein YtfP
MSNKNEGTEEKTLVGVYGSLLKGLGNHRLLSDAEFVNQAVLPPEYGMVSLGGFPGVYKDGDSNILLELYLVDGDELRNLDRLEGNGYFYTREIVETEGGDTPWVYLLPKSEYDNNTAVPRGDWRKFHG